MAKTTVFFDRDRDIFFVRTEKTVGRVYALPAYGAMPDCAPRSKPISRRTAAAMRSLSTSAPGRGAP